MKIRHILIASVVFSSIVTVVRSMILYVVEPAFLSDYKVNTDATRGYLRFGGVAGFKATREDPHAGLSVFIAENVDKQFSVYQDFLVGSFPETQDAIFMKGNKGYSMLYQYESGRARNPILSISHDDVVPSDNSEPEKRSLALGMGAVVESASLSVPVSQTATEALVSALLRLEQQPMPLGYDEGTRLLFEYLAPSMMFVKKVAFSNDWLFEPVIQSVMRQSLFTHETIKTAFAPTVIGAGVEDNILSVPAMMHINEGMLTGDRSTEAIAYMHGVVNDLGMLVERRRREHAGFPVSGGCLF